MEEFKLINGTENYYISDYGNVYSHRTDRLMKPQIDSKGYYYVGLFIEGKSINQRIHRLMGSAFIDNKEDKPYINHIDGDKQNNDIRNLEWCTASENIRHAYKKGLMSRNHNGMRNPRAKLTANDVTAIKALLKGGYTNVRCAELFNVGTTLISKIRHGFHHHLNN